MPNDYFEFKQFTIKQAKTAMKVGTDGVLLGSWADVAESENVLDIGAGTGLIALCIAQRSQANIDTVEIEENAYSQAIENIENCPWKNRINVYQNSIQDFYKITNNKYEHIVSNPPFFEKSLLSSDYKKSMARHNVTLTLDELFLSVNKLLTANGKFSLILPADNFEKAQTTALQNNLFCNRLTKIRTIPTKNPKRILAEFSHIESVIQQNELTIESGERHNYTNEYKNLTKDFYLAF